MNRQGLPTRVAPEKADDFAYDRQVIIAPSGKAFFVNRALKQFHWESAKCLGSDVISLAQHAGTTDYIDFADDSGSDSNLYRYTRYAQKQLVNFDMTKLSTILDSDVAYASLKRALQPLYPKEPIQVEEVKKKAFCLDFERGTMIKDATHHYDYICVVRRDLKITHPYWSLSFSLFQAHEPCPCGLPSHPRIVSQSCSRPFCRVAVARTYDELQRLTQPILHFPPQDTTFLELETRSIIDCKTVYRAQLEGKIPVTAEEALYFNVDAYRLHPLLNTHPSLLSFHGHTVCQNRLYRLFSPYERTLFHVISIDKMQDVSDSFVKQWVRDIVEGLRFVHNIGLYHGDVSPSSIVVLDSRALLHGLTTAPGSQEDDRLGLGALLFHLFTRGSCFGKFPTMKLCEDELKSDPEANDLVQGLIRRRGRLSLDMVMKHPKFFNAQEALSFISSVSNRVYAARHRKSKTDADRFLFSALKFIEADVYANIQEPGSDGMNHDFLCHSLDRGVREYGRECTVEALIRSFRNRYIHILEQNDQDQVLTDSNSLMGRIRAGYPKLVLLLYKNLPLEIREEEEFKRYYTIQ